MDARTPAIRRLSSLHRRLPLSHTPAGFRGQETDSILSKVVDVGVTEVAPAGCTQVVLSCTEGSIDGMTAAQAADFGGEAGSTAIYYTNQAHVAAGLGPAADVTSKGVRAAVTLAIKQLKSLKVSTAALSLPSGTPLEVCRLATDATIAAVLADYNFDIYITDASRKFHLSTLTIISSEPAVADVVQQAVAIAKGQCLCRDMVNTRAGIADPGFMEDRARDLCCSCPEMTLSVVDADEMLDKGMGLIYGVG
eukprot:COSAG05_NODE_466_length_9533_cov_5.547806_14_plen_251_part_00